MTTPTPEELAQIPESVVADLASLLNQASTHLELVEGVGDLLARADAARTPPRRFNPGDEVWVRAMVHATTPDAARGYEVKVETVRERFWPLNGDLRLPSDFTPTPPDEVVEAAQRIILNAAYHGEDLYTVARYLLPDESER